MKNEYDIRDSIGPMENPAHHLSHDQVNNPAQRMEQVVIMGGLLAFVLFFAAVGLLSLFGVIVGSGARP